MKTNKREMVKLLRKAQRFQIESNREVMVCSYYDKGHLWFTVSCHIGDKHPSVSIYEWRSPEENANNLENYINAMTL